MGEVSEVLRQSLSRTVRVFVSTNGAPEGPRLLGVSALGEGTLEGTKASPTPSYSRRPR